MVSCDKKDGTWRLEFVRPLDRIEIRGFKSIHEMDLKLGPINVLIGPNGAGKSNFVSIFQLLNQMMERQLQVQVRRWGGADSILHFGQKHTPEMDLRLHFSPNSYYVKVGPSADGGLFLIEETCSYQGWNYTKPYTVYLASGATESGLLEEAAKTENKIAKEALAK